MSPWVSWAVLLSPWVSWGGAAVTVGLLGQCCYHRGPLGQCCHDRGSPGWCCCHRGSPGRCCCHRGSPGRCCCHRGHPEWLCLCHLALDLVFTFGLNIDSLVSEDHNCILFDLSFNRDTLPCRRIISLHILNHLSAAEFSATFQLNCDVRRDIDSLVQSFNDHCLLALEEVAPIKTRGLIYKTLRRIHTKYFLK